MWMEQCGGVDFKRFRLYRNIGRIVRTNSTAHRGGNKGRPGFWNKWS